MYVGRDGCSDDPGASRWIKMASRCRGNTRRGVGPLGEGTSITPCSTPGSIAYRDHEPAGVVASPHQYCQQAESRHPRLASVGADSRQPSANGQNRQVGSFAHGVTCTTQLTPGSGLRVTGRPDDCLILPLERGRSTRIGSQRNNGIRFLAEIHMDNRTGDLIGSRRCYSLRPSMFLEFLGRLLE